MRLRTAHGAAAAIGADVVLEDEPLDEKPHAPAGGAVPLATGRDERGRVASTEAARALAKLPRRTAFRPRNIPVAEAFQYHYRERLAWLDHRVKEITAVTGACSAGVTMRLRRAAWAYAWSEYADTLAAGAADLDRAEQAARLAEKADKLDWSAWTMACREGQARDSRGTDDDLADQRRAQADFQRRLAARQEGSK